MSKFRALRIFELENGKFDQIIVEREIPELPDNELLVKVSYSGLNYKDALSFRGHKGITRKYPHTPGIDACGKVIKDRSGKFAPGDQVIVTGYDLGMNTDGGFGEYIRVPSKWAVKLPDGITPMESMFYGTPGFTAGICINELQNFGVTTESGKIIVTGATGAVGSLAIGMLSKAGYEVIGSTGKPLKADLLKELGAIEIIHRDELIDNTDRALLTGKYSAGIDTIGGNTLSTVFRSIKPRGAVAVVGLVESDKLNTNLYPFILRGISMIGIDSAERPMDYRLKIWDRIFNEWRIEKFESIIRIISLDDLIDNLKQMLDGNQYGRVLVKYED